MWRTDQNTWQSVASESICCKNYPHDILTCRKLMWITVTKKINKYTSYQARGGRKVSSIHFTPHMARWKGPHVVCTVKYSSVRWEMMRCHVFRTMKCMRGHARQLEYLCLSLCLVLPIILPNVRPQRIRVATLVCPRTICCRQRSVSSLSLGRTTLFVSSATN